jgi:hypothetical protein
MFHYVVWVQDLHGTRAEIPFTEPEAARARCEQLVSELRKFKASIDLIGSPCALPSVGVMMRLGPVAESPVKDTVVVGRDV